MRMENVNALVDLLNGDGIDEETGNSIFLNIDSAYNTLESFSEMSKTIFNGLTAKGKKRFYITWTVAGLELAYNWIGNECNDWDDRKKASEIFAYNNLCEIENLFKMYSDISLNLSGETTETVDNTWFPDWCRSQFYLQLGRDGLKENAWILAFARKFSSMHSTIKQNYFGGVVNGVIVSENPEHKFESNSPHGGYVFPFI